METCIACRVSGAMVATSLLLVASAALAQDRPVVRWPSADQPAYPTSPYHGVTDGNGRTIPCRCRFQGQLYRLGDTVCMTTADGVVMARCDLMLNNTSWVPTRRPCTVGRAYEPRHLALSR